MNPAGLEHTAGLLGFIAGVKPPAPKWNCICGKPCDQPAFGRLPLCDECRDRFSDEQEPIRPMVDEWE